MMRFCALTMAAWMAATGTGCSMVATHNRGLGVAADVAFASAALVVARGESCDESDFSCIDAELGQHYLTVPLVLAGLALGIGALASGGSEPEAAPPARAGGLALAMDTAMAAPATTPPPAAPAGIAPLPELPVDADSLALAQQAREAAARGDCAALPPIVNALRARDPDYAHALVIGPALAACLRRPALVH